MLHCYDNNGEELSLLSDTFETLFALSLFAGDYEDWQCRLMMPVCSTWRLSSLINLYAASRHSIGGSGETVRLWMGFVLQSWAPDNVLSLQERSVVGYIDGAVHDTTS